MTAKDILSPTFLISAASQQDTPSLCATSSTLKAIDADTPVMEIIPHLLDSSCGVVAVEENGLVIGHVDSTSLLHGLGSLIVPRDDSSTITIRCHHNEYSASVIARAVEDADAHLVDLISTPSHQDMIAVTLRVSHIDPSAVAASLGRHGYEVVSTHGKCSVDDEIAAERIAQLAVFLNV